MKKYLYILYLLIPSFMYSLTVEDLVGVWIPKEKYLRFVNNESIFERKIDGVLPIVYHDVYGMTIIQENQNFIFYLKDGKLLCNFDAHSFFTENIITNNDNKIMLDLYEFIFGEKIVMDHLSVNWVSEYEIILSGEIQNWPNSELIRISGPAKIPIKNAVLNDSNVRLRVKPNLNCDTWTKLSKGTKVKVKDKSSEEYEINGEKWYWYKVDIENLPDGWVYGKYLDIEE